MNITYINKQYIVRDHGFILGSFSSKRRAIKYIKKELSFRYSVGIIEKKVA